jgi:hypothetical protein
VKEDKLGKLKVQVKESLNNDFNFVGNEMILAGSQDCYTKFVGFINEFSDIIFICGLIGCAIWNILRLFVFGSLL